MNHIFTIFKREYLSQVRKKSFVVLTLLAPLLLAAFGGIVAYMFDANQQQLQVSVVDDAGRLSTRLKSHDDIVYLPTKSSFKPQILLALKDTETPQALLVVPSQGDLAQLSLYTSQDLGAEEKRKLNDDLSQLLRQDKIAELGIMPDQIAAINQKVKLKIINQKSGSEHNDLLMSIKTSLSFVLMYACFMFIMIYGVRVMRSVLEEKNNRVVEIIISSVKPFELMMGKILGVTAVALTQFLVWIAMTLVAVSILGQGVSGQMPQGIAGQLSEISQLMLGLDYLKIILVFVFYFLFGYLFYSAIYAAIGSAVDSETETSQFTMIVMIPLSIAVYGSFSIANNPDGPVGFWLSIIPLTSPVAMVARVAYGVALWELLLSMFLLVLSGFLVIKLAGKIYRIGILSHGNKANFKTILKWLKEV
jgi:ABC-2 type transport system permease protein